MKIKRISKKNEFKEIFENGKKFYGEKLSFCIKTNELEKTLALGIIISKKFVSKAVIRNYIRRVIKSFFYQKQYNNLQIIIRVYKKIEKQTKKEIFAIITKDIEKILLKTIENKNEKNNNIFNKNL